MRARILLPVAVAILLLGGAAHAEPTPAERERARTLVFEGRSMKEHGDPRGALEKFRAAHAIMRVPTTGIEVALVLVELKLLVEARDAMLEVSALPHVAGEPPAFAQAREEARQYADQLEGRIPTAVFIVKGPTDGATPSVSVDGTAIDPSLVGLPRKLNPGEHVAVAKAGDREGTTRFTLAERAHDTVTITLARVAPTDTAPPPAVTPPSEGPREQTSHTSPLVYAGFGVAIVGVAVGTVSGIISWQKTTSARNQCDGHDCTTAAHDDLTSARTTATISNVAFVVAAVGAAVGVVGLVLRPSSTANASAVRVVAAPGAISGSF
jgi:hypothetical protein